MGSTTGGQKQLITNKYYYFLHIYSIVDTEGETYFEIQSTDLMDGSIKMLDHKGKTIACARKERFGPGKMANIIVKNGINKYFLSLIKYFRIQDY